MSKRKLYTLAVPDSAVSKEGTGASHRVAAQGVIDGGVGNTESLSSQPGTKSLTGWYRGDHAEYMAQEFEELFGAQNIDSVPYSSVGAILGARGYYSTEDVKVDPPDPREQSVQKFDGRLIKKGTKQSHWRAVRTNLVDTNANEFGNDTTAYIGIPTAASKVRWFNPSTKEREEASVVTTRTGAHADVDIYDADSSSYDEPVAIYEMPYNEEGKTDTGVWDDLDNPNKTETDADGNEYNQWQQVFDLKHEWEGDARITNTLFRLDADESNNQLTAEEYSSGSWSGVSLGNSDWELFDFDVTKVKMVEIRGHAEFRDTTQSPTAYFTLDMSLKRGYNYPQWIIPPDETGPVPSGLKTKLDPIANESVIDPQESKSLVPRSEVRK